MPTLRSRSRLRPRQDAVRLQRVCPRWLHVLMPAEHHIVNDEEDSKEDLRPQVDDLRKRVDSMSDDLGRRQIKLADRLQDVHDLVAKLAHDRAGAR